MNATSLRLAVYLFSLRFSPLARRQLSQVNLRNTRQRFNGFQLFTNYYKLFAIQVNFADIGHTLEARSPSCAVHKSGASYDRIPDS